MATPNSVSTMDFLIVCPGCDGSGKSETHVYGDDRCIICRGKGEILTKLQIPKPGQKVKVRRGYQPMLNELFGLHESGQNEGMPKITHENVAVVHKIQQPEEHMLELRTGLGVQVSFDGSLTRTGAIPKGKTIDLWTFDLYELVIVG